MSLRHTLWLLAELALGWLLVVTAVSVVGHDRTARLEVGRVRLSRLDDSTLACLAGLQDSVFITYYVSPAEQMPSHLRRLEEHVTDLLAALSDASDGRLEYQIVDPSSDPALAAYAARRKVSPVRVRQVTRDAYSEQEIWSTLSISYGPHAPAVIQGLGDEHLPRLQSLVVEQIRSLDTPREPVFGLADRGGFEAFRDWLAERGSVVDVDLSNGKPLPSDVDVLFLMDPGPVDANRLDELDALLEAGRGVVVAGSRLAGENVLGMPGLESVRLSSTGYDGETLWGHFGLSQADEVVLDERCLARGPEGPAEPHRVLCIANNQDFHSMAFAPNGNLIFELPEPFTVDGEVLGARGLTAEVLASSSDRSWTQEGLTGTVPLAVMQRELGEALTKQALVVWLRPTDPWRGSMVACASSSPFRDDSFDGSGVAHPRFTQVLVETLASSDRLVLSHAEIRRPEPLPTMAPGARAGWRVFCVLLVPALLGVVALVRSRAGRGQRRTAGEADGKHSRTPWRGRVLGGGLVGALLVSLVAAVSDGGVDLTEHGLNHLHPYTESLAQDAVGEAALSVDVVFSERGRLPPELRRPADRVLDLLDALSDAGADLSWQRIDPETLDAEAQEELAAVGVEPVRITSRRDEVTDVRTVWSSLVLRANGRVQVLDFPDVVSHENLEFRLAFALWRLATGRSPHVAFASDVPRLSAAESHRYYQTKGLIPPLGKDEYSLARSLLEAADFHVTHVDPHKPQLPDDIDLLVWLQPRRSAEQMFGVLAEYMYAGGRTLLAVQHFNILPQQFQGADFDFVYWPRPQSPDVEDYYFPELGIQLVREVLFDELSLAIDVESQIDTAAGRGFTTMRQALPFLLRATGAHFAADSLITGQLQDQAFIWASFLRWDATKLAELGLTVKTLMTTSPRTWSLDWRGGFLPGPLLEGAPLDESGQPRYLGPLTLAALFEGRFPWPERAFVRGARGAEDEIPPYPVPEPVDSAADGRLLFLTCSELFKDQRLTSLAPEFRGDHLLLNAAASLALNEGLASVMARRPVARGFDRLPEGERLQWRAGVMFGVPLLYLLMGLARLLGARWRSA